MAEANKTQEPTEEDDKNKKKSEKMQAILWRLRRSDKWGNRSYLLALAIWGAIVLFRFSDAFEWSSYSGSVGFARDGAGLIIIATLITGVHLYLVNVSSIIFTEFGIGGHSRTYIGNVSPSDHIKMNLEAEKLEKKIIMMVVNWEVGIATLGTAVWGYGDLFYCLGNGFGFKECSG